MLICNWVLPTDTGFVGKIKISIIAIYDFLKQVCVHGYAYLFSYLHYEKVIKLE